MELSDAPEKIPSERGSIPGLAQCFNHYATPGPLAVHIVFAINLQKKILSPAQLVGTRVGSMG